MNQTITASDTLTHALTVATEAACEAGAFLLSRRGTAQVQRKKALHDELLDVDLEAEARILATLRAAFPEYGVLSEEAGADHPEAPCRWIVDPLDGSANFQHGSPCFGVAIALQVAGQTVLGVIYLPVFDELYSATQGQGATLNGAPIRVSETTALGEAIIHMGDFAKTGRHHDNIARTATIARLADTAGRVRMVGSAATDFAYVASGRADGLLTFAHHPWDIEAGRLLGLEAGGDFIRRRGRLGKVCSISGSTVMCQRLGRLAKTTTYASRH